VEDLIKENSRLIKVDYIGEPPGSIPYRRKLLDWEGLILKYD
jgi:hypothetical protein